MIHSYADRGNGEYACRRCGRKIATNSADLVDISKLNVEDVVQCADPVITFSEERLFHFNCTSCMKWWSIGDWQQVSKTMFCPHCGMNLPIVTNSMHHGTSTT